MKKIFSIITAVISGLVAVFLLTTCFIKTNVSIASNKPKFIYVFNQSTTATQTNGYTETDKAYNDILKKLNKASSVSVFTRLVNRTKLTTGVKQDLDGKFVKYNTSLKQKNIVVELVYDKQQDVVVEYGGHTKVVSYFCVAYVIPVTEEFSDVVVYYSTTNGDGKDEDYKKYNPLTIKAEPGKFIDYINTL